MNDPLQDTSPIDNPPMPWEEFRNRAFREWARKVAIVLSVVLLGCGVAAVMNALKWGF